MNENEVGGINRESLIMAMKLIPKTLSQEKQLMVADFLTRQYLRIAYLEQREYDRWVALEDPEQI